MTNMHIVFIPALMCTEKMYKYQHEFLATSNNIFVNIHTFTIKDISTITKAAEYIIAKIKTFNDKCFLVGTSLGGYIAMEIIKQMPSIVEKVCLINTTWLEDTQEKAQFRKNIIVELEAITDANFIGINNNIIKSYLHNITEDKVKLLKVMAEEIGRQGLINQQKLALSRANYKEIMINSNISCLIIGSKLDTITPPEIHHEMAQLIPLSKLYIIEECSHLSPIDSPNRVSQLLLDWLTNAL